MIDEKLMAELMEMVGKAESAFLSRWRIGTLRATDRELHGDLTEQMELYDNAMVAGIALEARIQAEAMVRGWQAAAKAMIDWDRGEDAYRQLYDEHTDTLIVIGDHRQSIDKPESVAKNRLFYTPQEAARMLAGMEMITKAKECFPGAEVLQIGPERGQRSDLSEKQS